MTCCRFASPSIDSRTIPQAPRDSSLYWGEPYKILYFATVPFAGEACLSEFGHGNTITKRQRIQIHLIKGATQHIRTKLPVKVNLPHMSR